MAITSAFQADDEGSIPSTRSNDFHFLKNISYIDKKPPAGGFFIDNNNKNFLN